MYNKCKFSKDIINLCIKFTLIFLIWVDFLAIDYSSIVLFIYQTSKIVRVLPLKKTFYLIITIIIQIVNIYFQKILVWKFKFKLIYRSIKVMFFPIKSLTIVWWKKWCLGLHLFIFKFWFLVDIILKIDFKESKKKV